MFDALGGDRLGDRGRARPACSPVRPGTRSCDTSSRSRSGPSEGLKVRSWAGRGELRFYRRCPCGTGDGGLGWPEGLEPSTGGSTNRCSAIELWPPRRRANGSIARRPPGRPRVVLTGAGRRPRFPTPPNRTHPDAPTRDPTGPHGTWEPPRRDLRTADTPQSPTYRGHITRIPPDIPGVRRSHVVPPFRAHLLASSPRRTALAIALLFGISSVFTFAAPSETFAWDTELVQLLVGGRPRRADQPEPRERRAQGAQGRLDARRRSPAGAART